MSGSPYMTATARRAGRVGGRAHRLARPLGLAEGILVIARKEPSTRRPATLHPHRRPPVCMAHRHNTASSPTWNYAAATALAANTRSFSAAKTPACATCLYAQTWCELVGMVCELLAGPRSRKLAATGTSVHHHGYWYLPQSTGILRFIWPIERAILSCVDLAVPGRSDNSVSASCSVMCPRLGESFNDSFP
jgi:hypothetical protein